MKYPEVNRPKHWAGKMAPWKKMLAARPDKNEFAPRGPTWQRKEPTSANFSATSI